MNPALSPLKRILAVRKGGVKAFVSWSGGKDSALACYLAKKNSDAEVINLLNILSENGRHSRSHHLGVEILQAQAAAMEIPILQTKATWQEYEEEFKKALTGFKQEGILAGVFGDIDVQEHRDWVERVCGEVGIEPLLPLWHRTRESLMDEFISAGFKAVIVAINLEFLGSEWLGRQIDGEFLKDIKRLPQVDICGEKGEYHTFAYAGPIFKESVEFIFGGKVSKDKHWFLELFPKVNPVTPPSFSGCPTIVIARERSDRSNLKNGLSWPLRGSQ